MTDVLELWSPKDKNVFKNIDFWNQTVEGTTPLSVLHLNPICRTQIMLVNGGGGWHSLLEAWAQPHCWVLCFAPAHFHFAQSAYALLFLFLPADSALAALSSQCVLSDNCSVFFCNTHFCVSISWQCPDFWSRVVFSVWLGGDHFVADFSRPAITLLARKPSQVQMHRNPVALKTIQLRSHDETWFHWNPAHLKQKMQGTYKKWTQINNRIGIKLIVLRGISCNFFQRKGEVGLSLPGVFWL